MLEEEEGCNILSYLKPSSSQQFISSDLLPFSTHSTDEMKKATDLYQQKQFEQHHHHVLVPRSLIEENSYLDSLTKFGSGEEEGSSHQQQGGGGATKGYLDTLSEDDATKSTWGVYKDQVAKAKEEMKHEDEVDCKNIVVCTWYALFQSALVLLTHVCVISLSLSIVFTHSILHSTHKT